MVPHKELLKDIGRVFFWYPVRWTVNFISFSSIYWIGKIVGDLDFIFSGSKRIDKMVKNISRVFEGNERDMKTIIRNNLQNHSRNVLEFIKYPQLNLENISNILSVEGFEFLDKELAKNKGVILATAHFGAKQMLQVGIGLRGYKVNQIHYHMEKDELTFIQKKVSQRQRIKIEEKIPADFISAKTFMRSAFNCLKKNQMLIIAVDGIGIPEHMKKGYIPYLFFGKRVLFPSNLLSLSKRTGASVVPAFVLREGFRHRIIIKEALDINSRSDEDIFKEFIEILENYIRKYPHFWEFWEEFEEGRMIVNEELHTQTQIESERICHFN